MYKFCSYSFNPSMKFVKAIGYKNRALLKEKKNVWNKQKWDVKTAHIYKIRNENIRRVVEVA